MDTVFAEAGKEARSEKLEARRPFGTTQVVLSSGLKCLFGVYCPPEFIEGQGDTGISSEARDLVFPFSLPHSPSSYVCLSLI